MWNWASSSWKFESLISLWILMCMKKEYTFLSLLILGPSTPGNSIDVYLQPLIEELKELWNDGVETYDASTKNIFWLRAAVVWTINNFPAYANLFGWSTKEELACPSWNKDTKLVWLSNGGKYCYMGHRRFLDPNHKFRYDKRALNGEVEFDHAPSPPTGSIMLSQVEGINVTFGKKTENQSSNINRKKGWWTRSIS